jgi:hypothetical protein
MFPSYPTSSCPQFSSTSSTKYGLFYKPISSSRISICRGVARGEGHCYGSPWQQSAWGGKVNILNKKNVILPLKHFKIIEIKGNK